MGNSTSYRLTAIRAAIAARAIVMKGFRRAVDKEFKRDAHDIVTFYDRAAEEIIIEEIKKDFPNSRIVGEEGGEQEGQDPTWVIDPIDGTSNFAAGIPFWCVSIGVSVEGKLVAGVIYNPVENLLFSADEHGAILNDKPLKVHSPDDPMSATLISSFPNAKDFDLLGDNVFETNEKLTKSFQAFRNLGSGALNLAYVASGWADATFGFSTSPWDVAAGAFILEKAGGTFRSFDGGVEVDSPLKAVDYYAFGSTDAYEPLGGEVQRLSTLVGSKA